MNSASGPTDGARQARTRAKRKTIPDRIRFEVFKRDGFACVYCGAKPPGVALTLDHVEAHSAGGLDSIDNLVTACRTCNSGKSNVPLSTSAKAHTRAAALEREREVAAIDAAYNEWLRERREQRHATALRVAAYYDATALRNGWHLNDSGVSSIEMFVGPMLEEELRAAVDIAARRIRFPYFDPKWTKTGRKYADACAEVQRIFRYFCGICHRTIRERKGGGA